MFFFFNVISALEGTLQGLFIFDSPITQIDTNRFIKKIYSKTSMARTLTTRYHGCFKHILGSLGTNPIVADLG